MIKTEIRLITTSSPVSNFFNGNFNQYATNWASSGSTVTLDSYPPLNPIIGETMTEQYAPIDNPTGWKWNNGYMQSEIGSDLPLWQDIDGAEIGSYYQVDFTIKGYDGITTTGETLKTYLWGNSGDTVVTGDGHYQLFIRIDTTGTTSNAYGLGINGILFEPSDGFSGGIGSIGIEQPTYNSMKVLDLYDDESFNLTFQIQSSISDKGASYSKTIKIPGTFNNNIIFNNLCDIGRYIDLTGMTNNTVVFLNKKMYAGIYADSVELLTGFLEVEDVLINDGMIEYECVFYSNLRSIADALGEKLCAGNENSIDDLDFNGYNHYHNYPNIALTQDPYKTSVLLTGATIPQSYSGSTGIYYPVVDYSNISSGNYYRMENMKGCLYVKEVWDKIFDKAGFTYTSAFLESPIFKKLITVHGNTIEEGGLYYDNNKFKIGNYGNYNGTEGGAGTQPITYNKVHFNTTGGTSSTLFNNNNTFSLSNYSWTITSSGIYDLAAAVRYNLYFRNATGGHFQVTAPNNIIKIYTRLIRKRNGVNEILTDKSQVYAITGGTIYTTPCFIWSSQQYVEISFEKADCFINDEFWVEIAYDTSNFNSTGYRSMYIYKTDETDTNNYPVTQFLNVPSNKLNYYMENQYVYAGDSLPRKMKQIDFIKSISNKFNLMFCEDKSTVNNLFIEPYDNFFLTGSTYPPLDWTSKVDTKKEIKFERIPDLIDKDVNLSFKDDSNDLLLKNYKDSTQENFGSKYIKNVYYSEDVEKVEDEFSSTFLGQLGSTNWVVSKIYKKQDEYTDLPTDGDYNYRILSRKTLIPSDVSGKTFTNLYITALSSVSGVTGSTVKIVGQTSRPAYAGYLDNPFYPTLDLNYGVAKYYLWNGAATPNNLGWSYWNKKLSLYLDINSKMLTCYMFLTHSDIAQLDFRREILINGHKYRLQRIKEWKVYGSSKVELIQVNPLDQYAYTTSSAWQQVSMSLPGGGAGSGTGNGGGGGVNTGGGNPLPDGPFGGNKSIINLQEPKPIVYLENYETYSGQTIDDESVFADCKVTDNNNVYPKTAVGIVIGKNNYITNSNFFIKGSDNIVNNKYATIIDGNRNQIDADNVFLINSDDNVLLSGYTNTVLVKTSGITIDSDNKVYISNKDTDTLADYNYVDTKSGDTILYMDNNFYDKTETDNKYATRGGYLSLTQKTTQTYNSNNEYIIADNYNGTGRTITLLDTNNVIGKVFIIHDEYGNAATNNITINAQGIHTINGSGFISITNNFGYRLIYGDGTNWHSN